MRCKSVQIRLDELRTGELEPDVCCEIEQHLDDCMPCVEAYEDITGIAGTLPSLMGECPTSCIDKLKAKLIDGYDRVTIEGTDLWVAFSSAGVRHITKSGVSREEYAAQYSSRFGRDLCAMTLPDELRTEIAAALRGTGSDSPEVDMGSLPEFERRVLEALLTIPRGEVRTYSWVAREAGNASAIRAVGNTCAKNPVPFIVPCHRVVPSSGGLGGYAFGTELKKTLLDREGVNVPRLVRFEKTHAKYVQTPSDNYYCFPTCRGVRDVDDNDLVLIRDEHEASERGLLPCDWCRPFAA